MGHFAAQLSFAKCACTAGCSVEHQSVALPLLGCLRMILRTGCTLNAPGYHLARKSDAVCSCHCAVMACFATRCPVSAPGLGFSEHPVVQINGLRGPENGANRRGKIWPPTPANPLGVAGVRGQIATLRWTPIPGPRFQTRIPDHKPVAALRPAELNRFRNACKGSGF